MNDRKVLPKKYVIGKYNIPYGDKWVLGPLLEVNFVEPLYKGFGKSERLENVHEIEYERKSILSKYS